MARHSFIQMSKLSNVKGRISYISDPKRQEYLYATFSTREDTPTYRRSRGRMTTPPPLWSSTTVTWPHGSGKSTEGSSPSRNRLKRRASERSSGIWRRRPNAGMTHGGSKHDPAATIMTEDAKTEKYTAGSPCGAYIGTPCKFEACRASI